MLNVLNNRKIYWNNTGLDMEYGASWEHSMVAETLQPLLGQLLAGGAILLASSGACTDPEY